MLTTDDSLAPPRSFRSASGFAVLFLAALGLLLASFPVRNTDLWQHLANGRSLLNAGQFTSAWLYDLSVYATHSLGGGRAIVGLKAMLVALTGVLTFWNCSHRSRDWRIPLVCTIVALLAVSSRVLPQPQTVSYLLLALLVSLRLRAGHTIQVGWLILLAIVWLSIHRSVLLGATVGVLGWLGQRLDHSRTQRVRRFTGMGLVLVAVGLMILPGQVIDPADGSDINRLQSPWTLEYVMVFRESPAALAFYPLFVLSLLAFLLNRAAWRWEWFLPWAAVAMFASLQFRAIPYFAIVAAPVLAWNLQEWFTRRSVSTRTRLDRGLTRIATAFMTIVAVAFLASAWTGWLQGPPYGPRSWGTDLPPGVELAANTIRTLHAEGRIPAGSKTLHVSPDTLRGFAWFCPIDTPIVDEQLVQSLGTDTAHQQFRTRSIRHVVVSIADRRLRAGVLDRLLDDPVRWPLLHVSGGVAILGWNDPNATDSPLLRPLDWAAMAYQPTEASRVPRSGPMVLPHWTTAFTRSIPPRSADRDEAVLLMQLVETRKRTAQLEHFLHWGAVQAGGLLLAGGDAAHLGSAVDWSWRGMLYQPPLPPSESTPPSPLKLGLSRLQQLTAFERGDVPAEMLYLAIRAARRATAANPQDAGSYLVLGQAYQGLLSDSVERAWARRLPQVQRLREIQASAALAKAVQLNPRSIPARFEYARHLQHLGCHDLAIPQIEAYRDLLQLSEAAKAAKVDLAAINQELERQRGMLSEQTREYLSESVRTSLADRALMAVQRGLTGRALDSLLASDFSAFGVSGMKLELDLLMRTGQAARVQAWAEASPEWIGSLGAEAYYWLIAQAAAADGRYDDAFLAFSEMISGQDGVLTDRRLVVAGLSQLVAQSVLCESLSPNNWSDATLLVYGRDYFATNAANSLGTLSHQADIVTLRGLLALEMGDIDAAQKAFQQVLTYFGDDVLEFKARPIAIACRNAILNTRR